jgi:hypothetical protein
MLLATGLTVVLATVFTSVVRATIVSTTGQITIMGAPGSVELDELESDSTMFAFDERQCVTLLAPLKVNISLPGTYGAGIALTPATIPAGTRVSSHLVLADRGSSVAKIELQGTLTTDAPILGLITTNGSLGSSDFLGAIGTVYPTGSVGRAMTWNQGDWVTLDAGLHSATIHVINSLHADQVRVITGCALPQTGFQGCTPGYWKQDQHFDSWQVYAPTDSFNAVFGVSGPFPDSLTLADALSLQSGGVYALARHAVAALLDSVHSGVDYGLTEADVIAKTQAALASDDLTFIEATKNLFAALNEKECPLN